MPGKQTAGATSFRTLLHEKNSLMAHDVLIALYVNASLLNISKPKAYFQCFIYFRHQLVVQVPYLFP